jgi:hypothetical protein
VTLKTIQVVGSEPKLWTAKDGSYSLAFIEGQFTDGSSFSYGAKPETFDARRAELQALVGQEVEFELEDKGLFKGTQQWKVKNYPGKPQPRGFGGGVQAFTEEQIEHLALRVAEEVAKALGTVPAASPTATAGAAPEVKKAAPKKAALNPGGATLQQVKQVKDLAKGLNWSDERLLETAGVTESLMELTKDDANELIGVLSAATLGADA